jgi:hypothetical protein
MPTEKWMRTRTVPICSAVGDRPYPCPLTRNSMFWYGVCINNIRKLSNWEGPQESKSYRRHATTAPKSSTKMSATTDHNDIDLTLSKQY